jgi:ribosomal protein L7Ae-like RNA K-turn-binding protein
MAGGDARLRLLGLAARAGAIVPGTERVREAVRSGAVYLVIVAADASDNSRDKLDYLLGARGVPCITAYDRAALGGAVGRAPLSAVGVTDRRLAERLWELGED